MIDLFPKPEVREVVLLLRLHLVDNSVNNVRIYQDNAVHKDLSTVHSHLVTEMFNQLVLAKESPGAYLSLFTSPNNTVV